MQFELFKVEKVNVDIDFKKLYDVVVNELEVTENDYDDHDDYAYVISDYFSMNRTQFLTDLCGLNFDIPYDDESYYDIEANDVALDNICMAFEDYVYNKDYEK